MKNKNTIVVCLFLPLLLIVSFQTAVLSIKPVNATYHVSEEWGYTCDASLLDKPMNATGDQLYAHILQPIL
jgi:Skp family chaperone for outer membrane proteins